MQFDFTKAKTLGSNDEIIDYLRNTASTNINWNAIDTLKEENNNFDVLNFLENNHSKLRIFDTGVNAKELKEQVLQKSKDLNAENSTFFDVGKNYFGEMFNTESAQKRKQEKEHLKEVLPFLDLNDLDETEAKSIAKALDTQKNETFFQTTDRLLRPDLHTDKKALEQIQEQEIAKQTALTKENYADLNPQEKKFVDKEVGAIEKFFRDYVPFVDSMEENFDDFKQLQKSKHIAQDVLLAIERMKTENYRILDVFSNDTEKQKKAQNFVNDFAKTASSFGFDSVAYDTKGDLYLEKQGIYYRVNENFFDNFLHAITANQLEIGGGVLGAIKGAQKGFSSAPAQTKILGGLGGAIVGGAIGSMGGAVGDSLINNYLLNQENSAQKIINKTLEAGLLSVAGDLAIVGITKIPLKKAIQAPLQTGKNIFNNNVFSGSVKNMLTNSNIEAAKDLLEASLSKEQQQAILDLKNSFGGNIKDFTPSENPILQQIKEHFGENSNLTKASVKLNEIIQGKNIKDAQKDLLEIIRSDESGSAIGLLLQVSKDSLKANKALTNILATTTKELEEKLSSLNIQQDTILEVFADLEVGTKASYQMAMQNILSDIYKDFKTTLPRDQYNNLRKELDSSLQLGNDELNFLKFVEEGIFRSEGVSFEDLSNARKLINTYFDKNPTDTKSFLKTKVQDFLLKTIETGIENIFKQNEKAYLHAKNLYQTALSDYANMKAAIKTLDKIKFTKEQKTIAEATNILIKYIQGSGGIDAYKNQAKAEINNQVAEVLGKQAQQEFHKQQTNLQNYKTLTSPLSEQNKQAIELSVLQHLFNASLLEKSGFKVFDSKNFFIQIKDLENIFQTQGAKEYITFLKGFDKLFGNDAKIALGLGFSKPSVEGSSIATTLEGALKQKYIKAVFATLIRNLPYNNILFSFFKEKIQQSALRYHLRKALEKSQDIESFKTNLQIRAEKANFNNATMQIIQNILKDTTQAIDEAREGAKTPTGVFTKAQEQETQQAQNKAFSASKQETQETQQAKQTQLTQQAENKVFEVLPQEAQELQTHFNFKGDKPLIREIRENEVSHALKSHGNEQTENKRGNIAITRADIYENYPAITQQHDEKFFTDKSVIYVKQVNGYHIGIEEALIGQDKLIFKSLWKTKGNYNREVLLRNAKASPYPQNADEAVKNDSISNPSLEQGNPLQSHPSNTQNLTTKDKIKQARELGLNAKEAVHYIKTNNLPQTRANTLPQGREILEAEIVETQEIPYSQKKLIEWITNKHPKLIGSNQQARLTTKELLEFIKEENLPAKEALKLIKNTPRNLPIKIDSTSKQTTQNVDSSVATPKQKTIEKVDSYAKSDEFKTLSKDKQEAILSLKTIEPSPMPQEITQENLENLFRHFNSKQDKAQREFYAKLFNDTKENPHITLEVKRDNETRQEYIKAYQHKDTHDLYYIAITKENDTIKVTGYPITKIKDVINQIKNAKKVVWRHQGDQTHTALDSKESLSLENAKDIIPQKQATSLFNTPKLESNLNDTLESYKALIRATTELKRSIFEKEKELKDLVAEKEKIQQWAQTIKEQGNSRALTKIAKELEKIGFATFSKHPMLDYEVLKVKKVNPRLDGEQFYDESTIINFKDLKKFIKSRDDFIKFKNKLDTLYLADSPYGQARYIHKIKDFSNTKQAGFYQAFNENNYDNIIKELIDKETSKVKNTDNDKIISLQKELEQLKEQLENTNQSLAQSERELEQIPFLQKLFNNKPLFNDFLTLRFNTMSEKELKKQAQKALIDIDISRSYFEKALNITPIKEFGTNYAEHYHSGQSAIQKLLLERNGQVSGAFYRKELGDIDLFWGDSSKGLAHILERRKQDFIEKGFSEAEAEQKALEFVKSLPDIIENGVVEKRINRAFIDTQDKRALIALDFNGVEKKWVITAYNKDDALSQAEPHSTKHNTSTSSVSRASGDSDIIPQNANALQKAQMQKKQASKEREQASKERDEFFNKYPKLKGLLQRLSVVERNTDELYLMQDQSEADKIIHALNLKYTNPAKYNRLKEGDLGEFLATTYEEGAKFYISQDNPYTQKQTKELIYQLFNIDKKILSAQFKEMHKEEAFNHAKYAKELNDRLKEYYKHPIHKKKEAYNQKVSDFKKRAKPIEDKSKVLQQELEVIGKEWERLSYEGVPDQDLLKIKAQFEAKEEEIRNFKNTTEYKQMANERHNLIFDEFLNEEDEVIKELYKMPDNHLARKLINLKQTKIDSEVSDYSPYANARDRYELEQFFQQNPIKEFGTNYAEHYHSGQSAIQKLINEAKAHKQSGAKGEYKGQVAGAFYRDDIGDITLAWGDKGTGKSDGWGLSKIAEYHPEVLDKLDKLIQDLPIVKETENRYKLDNGDFFISIRKDFEGQKQNWVLTALERDESIARRRTDLPSSQSEAEKTTSANATAIIPQTEISNIKKQLVELKESKSTYEKYLKDLERNMKDVELEERRYLRGEERIKVFERKRLIQSSIDEHTQGLNAVLKKMIELHKQLPENVRYTKEVLDDLIKIEAILNGNDYSLEQALRLSKITQRLQEKAIIESESFLNKVYNLDDFAKGAKSLQGTSYGYNTVDSIRKYFKIIAEMIDSIPAFKKISANQPETLPTSQTPKVDSSEPNFTYTTGEAKGIAELRKDLKQALEPSLNREIVNKETGIAATISTKGLTKISSSKAVAKTIQNGFTRDEHFKVAQDLKNLFENSKLKESHTDTKARDEIQGVYRFTKDLEINGSQAEAKITLFENNQAGNRIYSLELESLEKPTPLSPSATQTKADVADLTQSVGGDANPTNIAKTDGEIIPQNNAVDTKWQEAELKNNLFENMKKFNETFNTPFEIAQKYHYIKDKIQNFEALPPTLTETKFFENYQGLVSKFLKKNLRVVPSIYDEKGELINLYKLNERVNSFSELEKFKNSLENKSYSALGILMPLKDSKTLDELKEVLTGLNTYLQKQHKKLNKDYVKNYESKKLEAQQARKELDEIETLFKTEADGTLKGYAEAMYNKLESLRNSRNAIVQEILKLDKGLASFKTLENRFNGGEFYNFLQDIISLREKADMSLYEKEKARKRIEEALNITPIKEFGTNYAEHYHSGQTAIQKLLAEAQAHKQSGAKGEYKGQVAGAFYRKELGDIDLVWGEVEGSGKEAKGYGLAKIIEKHLNAGDFKAFGEGQQGLINAINQIIQDGKVVTQNGVDSIVLRKNGEEYRVGISKGWDNVGENKWIITSYKNNKYKESAETSYHDTFTSKEPLENPVSTIIPQESKSIKEEEIKEFLKNNGEHINSNYPQETATLILQQNKDNGIVLSGFEIKGKDYDPQLEVLEFKSKKAQREFETLMKSYDTKGDFLKFEKMAVFKPNDEAFLQYLKKYKDDKNAKLALAYNLSKDLIRMQGGGRLEVFMTNFLRQIHILENQNSTIYQSNPHIGAGLLGGSVNGLEQDENGNLSFDPAKFVLGFLGGAAGSKAVAQGFKYLKENPQVKEAVVKELADTLALGFEKAREKYPLLSLLEPRYMVQNQRGRSIQAKSMLKELEKEQRGLYNVVYNGKNATLIQKDLEAVDEAILFERGRENPKTNKGYGAEHILKHTTDPNAQGYITDLELVNIGKELRAYLARHKEPFIDKTGARLYEWEKEGVRFRLVVGDIGKDPSTLEGAKALSLPKERIITFYSDRNLKEAMEFKNPVLKHNH